MKLVRKLLARSRIRRARVHLADQAPPSNYACLAREHALSCEFGEALRVSEEGLANFPGSTELLRLSERVRARQRESRLRELRRELAEAPRPALWRELCETLLESGQRDRAEEVAHAWSAAAGGVEALWLLARVQCEHFFEVRNRARGRAAHEALLACERGDPGDARPLRLGISFAARVGAWGEAKRASQRLLELFPGDLLLEARFREYADRAAGAPELEDALRNVERTGELYGEQGEQEQRERGQRDLRPELKELAAQAGVHAALYLRGGTALVQGPKGASAERTARAVRGVVQSARSTARRLGLGPIDCVRLEHQTSGSLTVMAGELDAGALWCSGELGAAQERALVDLAGIDAALDEELTA